MRLCAVFPLLRLAPPLHPFPSRLLLTAKDRIESDGGACPPSSRRDQKSGARIDFEKKRQSVRAYRKVPVAPRHRRDEIGNPVRVRTLSERTLWPGRTERCLWHPTTCREAAHIEQGERSGALHIEWAQAHISSAASRHIST